MSDFTLLLPMGLPRSQKVAHDLVLTALRELITDEGLMQSLIKRAGLKLEVLNNTLPTTGSTPNISTLQGIVLSFRAQVEALIDWVGELEALHGDSLTLA